jgi:hypothetical protein
MEVTARNAHAPQLQYDAIPKPIWHQVLLGAVSLELAFTVVAGTLDAN